ncbi:MAG: cytochrome c peroxidase [Chlamydiales bacterium]|jgi:cytochrome c peroxidase
MHTPTCALAAPQGQLTGRTDDRALAGTLSLDEVKAMLVMDRPLGLTEGYADHIPADNPMTPAKVELGRQLYFNKRLSRDNTVSCATCHDQAKGWASAGPVSTGIDGQMGGRSAPTVINRVFGKTQFWSGRAASLEEQAVGPIANPIEMGFTLDEAVARLAGIEGYVVQFKAVFGGEASADSLGKAIAAFERTIVSGRSQNDYFDQAVPFFDWEPDEDEDSEFLATVERILDQEYEHRMSAGAERGRDLFFGKASCSSCHVGQDLTDEMFHNIGVGLEGWDADGATPDWGRSVVTGSDADKGAFKTPSVRNITLTAPYMHDGSLATLMEVVEHYDKGGTQTPWLSDKRFPLKLTVQEKQDLVQFLEEALLGPITEVAVTRLP